MFKKNRKVLSIFLTLIILFSSIKILWADEISISAEAGILIDAQSGQILYQKNSWEKRPPASTTKILTGILAIEKGNLHDVVKISNRAALTGEASLNLIEGEEITLYNLLYGALLKSGNDACVAIAEGTSPHVEEFIYLMNLKAKLLGCYNSNFVNTNGLPAKNHYSSAYDLALISMYALKNPVFSDIVNKPQATVEWFGSSRKRLIKNTNRLLTIYPGATGIKTGTTDKAGQCLVASASQNNRDLISVVLKSQNRFGDSVKLLNYGFNNFKNVLIEKEGKIINLKVENRNLILKTGKDLIYTIKNNDNLNITHKIILDDNYLSLYKEIGRIKYYNNDKWIGNIPLILQDYEDITKINIFNKIINFLKNKAS